MADRDGRDEPAPIAYDGVLYVNNPPNVDAGARWRARAR